jgi:hypothetical protein
MRALPHTPEWQVAAMVLLAGGLITLAVRGYSWVPALAVAGGLTGIVITLLKCIAYAWRSDVDRLPAVGSFSRRLSRVVYRATIAWLHVVQPFARSWGYLQGLRRPPTAVTSLNEAHAAAAVHKRGIARGQWGLLLGQQGECRFWSETWVTKDALLTRVVERLRLLRFGRGIHVDDGWRPDRDISVALGPWAWAHVQALVEDHGTGRCLFRARIHVRPRALAAILAAVTIAIAAVVVTGEGSLVVAAAAFPVVAVWVNAMRILSRGIRQVLDVVADVAGEFGMHGLASPRRRLRPKDSSSSWDGVPATHGG